MTSNLAEKMDVSTRTIRRWLTYLEGKNALVRIPVAGKVCAYALDLTRCGKVMIHLRNMLLS